MQIGKVVFQHLSHRLLDDKKPPKMAVVVKAER